MQVGQRGPDQACRQAWSVFCIGQASLFSQQLAGLLIPIHDDATPIHEHDRLVQVPRQQRPQHAPPATAARWHLATTPVSMIGGLAGLLHPGQGILLQPGVLFLAHANSLPMFT